MDAMPLDIWIEAQNPPVYEEIAAYRSGASTFGDSVEGEGGVKIRRGAIRETAFGLAAQTALAWRYDQLLTFTKSQEGTLDRIASFAPFVVDEHMLLPSITEVRDRFELSSDDKKLRTVEIQYRVDEPPRAISVPPTWRDYLWREFSYPEPPHPKLLPRSSAEADVWEDAIEDGWESGLRQAHFSWTNNLNELVQDIRGRITYRILEARGIVERPVMVGSEPEMTTGGDGKVVNAGDTVYSVAVPMSFKNQDEWGALWVSDEAISQAPMFGDESSIPNADRLDIRSESSADNPPVFGEVE